MRETYWMCRCQIYDVRWYRESAWSQLNLGYIAGIQLHMRYGAGIYMRYDHDCIRFTFSNIGYCPCSLKIILYGLTRFSKHHFLDNEAPRPTQQLELDPHIPLMENKMLNI